MAAGTLAAEAVNFADDVWKQLERLGGQGPPFLAV